jgi:hypothetical protein
MPPEGWNSFRRSFKRSREEIKSRLKSGNACCHPVQNLLSSSLLSKNIKITVYRTIILPVLYGCGTWSLTLREKHKLRVSENRELKIVVGHERDEVRWEWRKPHNEELIKYSEDQIEKNEMGGGSGTCGRRGA